MSGKDILKARQEIDKIDKEISELVEKRIEIAEKVIRIKKENGFNIEDYNRENEIIGKVTTGKKAAKLIENIYRSIFKWVKER